MSIEIKDPHFGSIHYLEDEVIYLYILSKMPEKRIPKALEMKIHFILRYIANKRKLLISRLPFIKEKKGPISKILYDIRRRLSNLGIIIIKKKKYVDKSIEYAAVNSEMHEIYDLIEEWSREKEYQWVISILNDVINKYGNTQNTFEMAKKEIYPLMVGNKKIKDYSLKEKIQFNDDDIVQEFRLDPGWAETFLLYLSRDFMELVDGSNAGENHPPILYDPKDPRIQELFHE